MAGDAVDLRLGKSRADEHLRTAVNRGQLIAQILLQRSVVALDQAAHLLEVQIFREGRPGRTVRNAKKPLISSGAFTMNARYHFMISAA